MAFIKHIRAEVTGSHMLIIGNRCMLQGINEWRQISFRKRYNWYNFTPIKLTFELDRMAKEFYIECVVFGFGVFMHIDYGFEHSMIKQLADEAYEEVKNDSSDLYKRGYHDGAIYLPPFMRDSIAIEEENERNAWYDTLTVEDRKEYERGFSDGYGGKESPS